MNRNGMNLVELAQEIMRRAEAKRDFVAATTDLAFFEACATTFLKPQSSADNCHSAIN